MSANFAIDLVTALWLGFFGACIGSFLNVVAYRMPRGMSVIWKPSHCPHCGHPIRARDNVPVLGWLVLRGKCRDCGGPISPRYAIVEAVMGAAFFVLAYVELFSGGANLPGGPLTELRGAADIVWSPQWWVIGVYAYHCLLLCLLMCTLLISRDKQPVPLRLAVIALVIGLIAPLSWHIPVLSQPGSIMAMTSEKLVACVVGYVCGWIWEGISKSPRSNGAREMLAVSGVFLGWEALVFILPASIALSLVSGTAIAIFCAVWLLLTFGHALSTLL